MKQKRRVVSRITENIWPYQQAKEYMNGLGLQSVSAYREWQKTQRPFFIPSNPDVFYRNSGWKGIQDWLGPSYNGVRVRRRNVYLPFEEAREYARSLNFTSFEEWRLHTLQPGFPDNIPVWPDKTYKGKGWISSKDWLGTYLVSFEEAKALVQPYNFRSLSHYQNDRHLHPELRNVPVSPGDYYEQYHPQDFFGYDEVYNPSKKNWRSFEEAREYARSLKLNYATEWYQWASSGERPQDIPTDPNKVYFGKGWVNFPDWLGYAYPNKRKPVQLLPFEQAREVVRSQNFQNKEEWLSWQNRPKYIPNKPEQYYRYTGWNGLNDFLGIYDK